MAKSKPKRKNAFIGKISLFLLKTILWFFIISVLLVVAYRFVNPPLTYLMIRKGFERKDAGKSWKIDKKWRDFDEISFNLKKAVLAAEDQNFMNHHGFDMKAIQNAYKKNKKGKNLRGGSTISQQTAKNVFLWQGRSWVRKGFEAYFTVLIEFFWGKKRILEVYLNVIEMGDGIYGAEAATQYYYQKPATALTRRQAALLSAVFPNPIRWRPDKPTAFINRRAWLIQRNMRFMKDPKFD